MMVLKEIIHAPIDPKDLHPEKLKNCIDLTAKVNIIRAKWGKPMIDTSGVRTVKEHLRIYASKGITDIKHIPMKSEHLETVVDCAAVDISDPHLALTDWLKNDPEGQAALEEADLYCEDGNSNWCHFQNKPFGSYKKGGTRWFKP